jgi:MFS family permease
VSDGARPPVPVGGGIGAVLRVRPFLLLWLAQVATQVGGNMVIYGLTVVVFSTTRSNAAVSLLLLTFLVPAVLFSAVAGVYVDRFDRRTILVATNVLRGLAFAVMWAVGPHLVAIYLLNAFVSLVTVFFAPAEASMIPQLVPRRLLIAANGLFTFTLNAAFALGFALFGPLLVTLAGTDALLLVIAALYLVAAGFCATLPAAPPDDGRRSAHEVVVDAERAMESTFAQFREGLAFIAGHRAISWSLAYLAITASLVGVLGVLGPDFATRALGLAPKDFVVVVLPLGFGLVLGILLLNTYGGYLPRRRVIEGGLVALGCLLGLLSAAGPITRALQAATPNGSVVELSGLLSLLAVVVAIAFLAGIAYAVVAIPAQTQLHEDLPADVRGRVFGVLNMLVSMASFVPIIVVGPIADLVGTPPVIFGVAVLVLLAGVGSILLRGPLRPGESALRADQPAPGPVDPLTVALGAEEHVGEAVAGAARAARVPSGEPPPPSSEPVPPPRGRA